MVRQSLVQVGDIIAHKYGQSLKLATTKPPIRNRPAQLDFDFLDRGFVD